MALSAVFLFPAFAAAAAGSAVFRRAAAALAILRRHLAVDLAECLGEAALALIADGLGNGRDVVLRLCQACGGRLHAVLLHMLAQVCDMKVGEFVHVIADAHIYDRHIPMIEELIKREPLPAPKFWLNPEVKDFYEFTPDDVRLDGYETHPQIKNIPIAV